MEISKISKYCYHLNLKIQNLKISKSQNSKPQNSKPQNSKSQNSKLSLKIKNNIKNTTYIFSVIPRTI